MADQLNSPLSNRTTSNVNPISDHLSLLWPHGSISTARHQQLGPGAWRDLGLNTIVAAFTTDPDHQREIAKILTTLCQDTSVIQYRQDVLSDLLGNPSLVERLETLLPAIDALGRYSFRVVKDTSTLQEVTWRAGELQTIVACILGLAETFQEVGQNMTSQGLKALQTEVTEIQKDPTFQNLVKELPKLLSQLRTCASVTIGVNLDQFLRPVEATLLSVNEDKFTSQSMLGKLFGKKSDGLEGITPLHSVPRKEVNGPYALPVSSDLGWAVEPMMVPLFEDLAKVIEKTARPIAKQLRQYTEIKSRLFVNLRQDMIFYLGALRFLRRMQTHGLPVCRPQLAPAEERVCEVEGSYNARLALHFSSLSTGQPLTAAITLNDIQFGPDGRILILTGPNQGGKTTYMQGVALVQVLTQVGLYIPGRQARISPVDNIYTHFPLEEKPEADTGRLGEETKRLGEIFAQVTPSSLILLNESLASTSPGESLYLAQDVVRVIRRIGARAIYSTHLHELAGQAGELNATTHGDSKIISIVASPIEPQSPSDQVIERSYKVEVRPPLGRSYAKEIAERYGISYEQLEKVLTKRGIL